MKYWLMKSEPDSFSIDDLKEKKKTPWDGVRNYQARNFMRDEMKKGDLAFFYHSACKEPGIVGLMEVCSDAYDDPTQFDKKSKYYDEKSTPEKPRWQLVDLKYKKKFKKPLSLKEMKSMLDLEGLKLLEKGSRLSIIPVSDQHFQYLMDFLE